MDVTFEPRIEHAGIVGELEVASCKIDQGGKSRSQSESERRPR